eukprot:TRINITY_DN3528_c2_g1_i1.p1 TRINITY_DN3528_c2_g1~~TRINITY_DN3528_c2_g1_i1.p1  ORF type:complete len:641 (+),score=245.15 TRINITY_DN3528_c2_g1_i1:100-2022(+)
MTRLSAVAVALMALTADAVTNEEYTHCPNIRKCPMGKPGCKEADDGNPTQRRVEMYKQTPKNRHKYYYYIGKGRMAKLSCLHMNNLRGSAFARLAYSRVPSAAELSACASDSMCSAPKCVWTMDGPTDEKQPTDCALNKGCSCRAVSNTNGDNVNNGRDELVVSRTIEFARDQRWWKVGDGVSAESPFVFKAHGRDEVDFYVEYWTDRGDQQGTPGGNQPLVNISLSFTVQATNPSESFCVKPDDLLMEMDGFDADKILNRVDGALNQIPRHQGFQFQIDNTATIASASSNDSWHHGINYHYWDLGRGPQIDLSCLNVYSTMALLPYSAKQACTDAMYGIDSLGTTTAAPNIMPNNTFEGTNLTIDLVDTFDCDAYTKWSDSSIGLRSAENPANQTSPYFSRDQCCFQSTSLACASLKFTEPVRAGGQACWWNHENQMCYPVDSMSTLSLKGMLGVQDAITVASAQVHGPRSSYVVQEDELAAGFMGQTMRRWFLRVGNQMELEKTGGNVGNTNYSCPLAVTVSYMSNTNGGVCEPGGRQLCDAQAERCVLTYGNALSQGQQYWKLQETGVTSDSDYRACNCLKEKEICYRKIGCSSTKRYQLILQNCYDQGCGDYCNSGAGLRASLIAIAVAVAAVFMA